MNGKDSLLDTPQLAAGRIHLYNQAIAITRNIGDQLEESSLICDLGNVYVHLEVWLKAIDLFHQGLAIAHNIQFSEGIAIHAHNIGSIYHHLGQYEQAIPFIDMALVSYKEIDDQEGYDSVWKLHQDTIDYR